MNRFIRTLAQFLRFGAAYLVLLCSAAVVQAQATFADDELLYDGAATTVQWGDIDGDGLQDMFIAEGGKHSSGNSVLSWFKAPNWVEYAIGPDLTRFTGDSDLVDIDKDGHLDIVVPRDDHADLNPAGSMQWYRNPGNLDSTPNQNWTKYTIEANVPDAYHQGDLETADVDNDGKLDIVVRSLGINRFVIYFQNNARSNASSAWTKVRIDSPHPREGLVIGDLDGNDKVDIIGNGFILFAPNNPRACTDPEPNDGVDRCMATWFEKAFDSNYYNASQSGLNNSTKGEVFDMDGDGRLDILQSSAEGNDVYLAWYKNPSNAQTGSWSRTIIESPQGKNHNVQVGDVDLDGDVDVLGGFSFGAKKVVWWENLNGDALTWQRHQIDGTRGCYSCVAADFDNDGDLDFAGPTRYANKVYLFRNTTADGAGELSLAPTSMSFASTGGSQSLAVTSSTNWTAVSNQTWLTLSQNNGSGDDSISVNASNYDGFGNRSGVVTVTAGLINRNLSVSQLGVTDSITPTVPTSLTPSNLSYDSFDLTWGASSDNSEQALEYIVYFSGIEVQRTLTNSISLTGLAANTIFNVTVSAVDPSGNESEQSSALVIVTDERPESPPPFAHWKLDETSGATASDEANDNDGSLAGGMAANQWDQANGLLGEGALRFDGGGERVSLGTMNSPSSAITIIGWIKPSNIASNSGEGRIISKASGSNANQHLWMISTDENGNNGPIVPRVRLNTGGTTKTLLGNTNSTVSNDVWSQIVASYDGSVIKLYHNSVEVGSVSASGAIAQDSGVSAVIGNQPAGDRGFEGLIDDVCIFDYAISAEDIAYLYNGGLGRQCNGLGTTINVDTTAPTLAEITAVPSPSFETSPGYVFATNEAGLASFSGSCFDSIVPFEVSTGEIVFGFAELPFGTYSDCAIVVTDAAGNSSAPLSISSFTILEPDTTRPTVSISQAPDQADPTSSNLAKFLLTFSEPIRVLTLIASDITLDGTTGSITVGPNAVDGSNNTQFGFSVTGMSLNDTVSATLSANKVADTSGNLNEASTSSDNTVLYACDNCNLDDEDGDGIDADLDNCPVDENADQADVNSNGVGDVCEARQSLCFPVRVKNNSVVMVCL